MRRLLLRHGIETGLRQAELSTLTGEFHPPHIDRVPKTQSEIHCSGMSATEEYSIQGPEHQDLICSNCLEHGQDAASRFLRRQCFCHSDPSPRILSHPATATLRRECTAANFTQNATQNAEFSKGRSVPGPAFSCNLFKGSIIRGNSPDLSTEAVHGQRPRISLGLYAYFAAAERLYA